jgi:hypothetical protein
MQRWIALAAVVFAIFAIFLGGGWYAFSRYKSNRPHPVWIPLAVNAAISHEEQLKAVATIEKALREPKVLGAICTELSLEREWEIADSSQCARELESRIFVKTGTMDTPQGSHPAILVGIRGKVKHKELSEKICMRMMDDVAKALNLPPPPKARQSSPPAP